MKNLEEFLKDSKQNEIEISHKVTNSIKNCFNEKQKKRGNFNMNKQLKVATAICACLIIGTGVVFAGVKVYENIWKNPEKIENITMEITEESKKENINEETAKNIAIKKLEDIGFNSNIARTDHYKEVNSDKIMYRFENEDKFAISIDGQSGEFFEIWNNNKNTQDRSIYITENEAIEVANSYYKLFGFKEGEYEVTSVNSLNNEFTNKGDGFTIDITYNKKYGEVYNPYEYIAVSIESKNKALHFFRAANTPFDNNDVIITQEEAVNIALKEDEKVATNKVESTKSKLKIVKMNADSYDRTNNTEKHYDAMQTVDYPTEERSYYKVDERVRNAWVVVITYEDNYGDDIVKRYTEGQYSYFVDVTTGEIIGGATMDYLCNEDR